MVNLNSLNKICTNAKKPPGLLAKLSVTAECDIASIPAANVYDHAAYDAAAAATHPHTISGNITLEQGAAWHDLIFRDNQEAVYECNEEGEEDAEEQVVTINFFRPTLDPFTTWLMTAYSENRLIVKFWDKGKETDYPRIAGEKNNGVKVSVKEQVRPKNGYVVSMVCRMRKKPFWYAGS